LQSQAFEKINNNWTHSNKDKLLDYFQKDFLTVNANEIREDIKDRLKLLTNRRSTTPKAGIETELMRLMKVKKHSSLNKLLVTRTPEILAIMHKALVKIYDNDFNDIENDLKRFAKNGEIKARPARYKELKRSISKYLSWKEGDDSVDFLDIDDLLGFRATFDSVDEMIEFMLNVLSEHNSYRIARYVGTTEAYQGINAKMNYEGRVNYELQSVVDIVQVVTDIQHDILYKSLIKIDSTTTDKVRLVIKLALGIVFHQIRK